MKKWLHIRVRGWEKALEHLNIGWELLAAFTHDRDREYFILRIQEKNLK